MMDIFEFAAWVTARPWWVDWVIGGVLSISGGIFILICLVTLSDFLNDLTQRRDS